MLYLLTNDDGIDAPGLAALQAAAGPLGDVFTVAPRDPQSECSHRVTTKAPLTLTQRAEHLWAADGSPADCTRIGLLHLLPQRGLTVTPDRVRVLSGINAGGNLGADVYVSGTVAAAREAAFFGFAAVALSQLLKKDIPQDWPRATRWATLALRAIETHEQGRREPGTFWNVNFPALAPGAADPPISFCPRSRQPLPVKYQLLNEVTLHYTPGLYMSRRFEPGSDVDLCFRGHITVTRIEL